MTSPLPDEFYSLSDLEAQRTYVGVRRAEKWVGFFLPHLHSGMSLLDCGCGVGSITLDLAEQLAPGQVIGLDMDEGQLEIARESAAKRGLSNVSFQQGNIYSLDFPDASFDAVLAHTLLFHLSEQLRALQEIRRVLKSGGVAAVSDDEWNTFVYSPDDPMMEKIVSLWKRVVQANGGNPYYSRHLRGLMLQAGFARTEGHAIAAEYYGNLEDTRRIARIQERLFHDPEMVSLVIGRGWITQAELDKLLDFFQRWAERPDAFLAVMYCAAVGWAD
jgi:ubiquinone/menaquinone biosynthesis C-methylase UbiE